MKNVSLNKILLVFVFVIVLINAIIIGNYLLSRRGGSGSSSATMLFTQPVKTFVGDVEAVSGDTLTIKYQSYNEDGSLITTPVKVIVDESVKIVKESSIVPYYFKNIPTPAQPAPVTNVELSALQPGDSVSITSAGDLRVSSLDKIKATTVTVRSPVSQINGTVESVSGSTLIVSGMLPLTSSTTAVNPELNKQDSFTVSTNSNTEFAQIGMPDPTASAVKAEKINISSIKPGTAVVVYFEKGSNRTTVNALLVQVMTTETPRTASTSATPANASPTVSNTLPTSAPEAGN